MKRTTQLVLLLILLVLATVLLVLLVLPGRYGVSPPAGACCPDTIHVDATASALSSSAEQTKMAVASGGSTPGGSLTAAVPTEMLPSEGGGGEDGGGGGDGGGSGSGSGGRPTKTALPVAVAEPIRRRAELSYPKKVEVNRSTTVRFTIFAPNDPPESEPGNETPQVPMTITNVPGMHVRISVILEVHGATKEDRTDSEQDLTNYNLWEWAITPAESGDISLKPHVSVRYLDSNNVAVQAVTLDAQNLENLWTAQSVTIPASNVVSNVFFESMGSWFNANLLGVVAIVLGLPGTVISWRELAGRRRPAQSAASS